MSREVISASAMNALAKVLEHGAAKHPLYGWKTRAWSEDIAACTRHLAAFASGVDIDADSGRPHIDHAFARLMFLVDNYRNATGEDDRHDVQSPTKWWLPTVSD